MLKLNLLLLIITFSSYSLISQNYVQLSEDYSCGSSKMYSIYGTAEDVELLNKFIKDCDDLEFIRVKGFMPGDHWDKLFTILSNNKKLKGLELFYNDGLEKVPKQIKNTSGLRTISIVGNKNLNYEDLFKKLSKLDSLQKISLVDNKLKEVPGAFKAIKGLKKLHVSGNENLNYSSLIENLKDSEIEELSIPLNSLSDIPENIKFLDKLKVLDIRKNYVAELPNEIGELDSLRDFKSEDNIFLDVNEELSKLKGLNIKYLSFDPIKEEALNEIKGIFPNATLDNKSSDGFSDESGELNQVNLGQSFDESKIQNIKECNKAIKQFNGLFLRRNDYSTYDSLGFFERLSNVKYSYNEKVLADGRFEGVKLMSHNKILQKKDVNFPVYKTKKGEIAFSICPDGNLYPELKAFNGMLWVYVGDKSKKDFIKLYVNKKSWKDVYLEFDKSNETFFIVLKGDFLEKIPAYPRYVNPQSSLKHAKLHYGKKFQMYERRLELRSERFNKELKRLRIKNELRQRKRENKNWVRLKSYMCQFEKDLNKQGWLRYKAHVINENHKELDTLSVSSNSLKISSKIRYVLFRESKPSLGKNSLNSVSGKVKLHIEQSSGYELPTKCFVFYPGIQELNWFNGELDGAIELKTNLNFIVVFVKDDLLTFVGKDEFLKEVRSSFSEKNIIPYSISRPFVKYSLKDFWNTLNTYYN